MYSHHSTKSISPFYAISSVRRPIMLLTLLLLSVAYALPATSQQSQQKATADYVIIGCGVAGLVLSARLSEIEDASVLCLEAGALDNYEVEIQIPYYIGNQPPGFYEWGLSTVPQLQLDGQSRSVPVGCGVGGGSLINGMVWNRGNKASFNSWASLGNTGWDWNGLLPYFLKSENFTAKAYPDQTFPAPQSNGASHGKDGSVCVSYPNYFWNQSNNWFEALESLGIPTVGDPNEGLSAGGYFLPLSIDASNQTRSDARRAYYDPIAHRANLDMLPHSWVTKIMFDTRGQLHATAVEYSDGGVDAPRVTVEVQREVILAAGALHTPQILELSGIGQKSVIEALGIQVLQELSGVGNNLQDHGMVHLNYTYTNRNIVDVDNFFTNSTFNQQSMNEYYSSKTGPWTAKPSQAVAFPSLEQILADPDTLLKQTIKDQGWNQYLPSSYDNTLRAGYLKQQESILAELQDGETPVFENLNNNAGAMSLALMRPLSRGTVHISSANPFQAPAIDPRWLAHPFDSNVLISAMEFNQRILDTPQIQSLQPSYQDVPRNASRHQLAQILLSRIGTEYHYAGSAAMLPQHLGGVVSSELMVYGTNNVRIVDTSIFPMVPGAHLQAVAYAVAEKAADIIKGIMPGPA